MGGVRNIESSPSKFEESDEAEIERKRNLWQRMGRKVLDAVKNANELRVGRQFQRRVELTRARTEAMYNDRLDAIEYLEEALTSQKEGITKTIGKYEGQQVDVYNLAGLPFHFIQHSLDGLTWTETADGLRKNPELWMKNKAELQLGSSKQYGDTLSVSYIDAGINVVKGGISSEHGLIYGFSKIRPGTLLQIHSRDGGTPNRVEYAEARSGLTAISPDNLAKQSTHFHNEVLLKRYNEDGKPMKPDFLIARDGVVTEDAKRHALYFGVPIVNIETASYIERQKEKLLVKLEHVNENSEYSEIVKLFTEAEESSLDIDSTWKEDIYDDYRGKADLHYQGRFAKLPEEARVKFRDVIERIEPAKRLELLDDKLRGMIDNIKKKQKNKKDNSIKPIALERIDGVRYEEVDGEISARAVDALRLSYRYVGADGNVKWISTLLQEPGAAYKYFSELADEYEGVGGVVWDRRWSSGKV